MPHVLFSYVTCFMVNHQLLNVDNHYDSLIKYAIIVKYIGYFCLNKGCWHIYIYLAFVVIDIFFINT